MVVVTPASASHAAAEALSSKGRSMRGVLNIIIGAVFIIGGATGKLELRFTQSSAAIIVVGVVLVGLGLWRLLGSDDGKH